MPRTALDSLIGQISPRVPLVREADLTGHLQDKDFRYEFSVGAMRELSHIIEDAAGRIGREGALQVCFQSLSRFRPQVPRYRRLTGQTGQTLIYGAADWDAPALPNATYIDITGSALTSFWFVTALGRKLSLTLLAEERARIEGVRYFEGIYTLDRTVALSLSWILHSLYPSIAPPPGQFEG